MRLLSQCTTDGSGEVCALSNDELNLLNFLQYWSNPVEFEAMSVSMPQGIVVFRMLKTTSICTYTCVTTSQFQLLYTKSHMIFVLKLMSVLKKVDGSQVILTQAVLLSPAPRI